MNDVLDVREAAELLRVRPVTVREQARMGRLPGRRIGRDWRFSRRALLDWLGTIDDEPLSAADVSAIHEGLTAIEQGGFVTLDEYERGVTDSSRPASPGATDAARRGRRR